MSKLSILVVDDDAVNLTLLETRLKKAGYEVAAAPGGAEAVQRLDSSYFDVVITDLMMPEVDGLGVLDAAKKISAATEVIMITGFADVDSAVSAMKLGATDYLQKPVNFEELLIRLQKIEQYLEIGHDLGELQSAKDATESNAASTIKTLEVMVFGLQKARTEVLRILEDQDLGYDLRVEAALETLSKEISA